MALTHHHCTFFSSSLSFHSGFCMGVMQVYSILSSSSPSFCHLILFLGPVWDGASVFSSILIFLVVSSSSSFSRVCCVPSGIIRVNYTPFPSSDASCRPHCSPFYWKLTPPCFNSSIQIVNIRDLLFRVHVKQGEYTLFYHRLPLYLSASIQKAELTTA